MTTPLISQTQSSQNAVIGSQDRHNEPAHMAARYLLHFAHEHLPFRWPEFLAVTSRNNCNFELISPREHIKTRPYILIELKDESNEHNLVQSAKESFLLKDLYEFWAHSKTIDDLSDQVEKTNYFLSGRYASADQCFRVNCESFGTTLAQKVKIEYIKKMTFLDHFDSRPNLANPKQIYCIMEMNEKQIKGNNNGENIISREYYFCRHLAKSSRHAVDQFSLKRRAFIANTSMDPLLSLIAANAARVEPADLVYDPFVGSGSLLVAAAHMGGFVLGSDIDWLLMHGKSRPSRKGEKARKKDECVRANLRQYNLESRYLDVMVSDITKQPFNDRLTLDSIITDPPYGIRECSEKIGNKRGFTPKKDSEHPRYPAKVNYSIDELLLDLLLLAVRHLKINGRLVYFLPVTRTAESFQESIPTHPCLELISYCDQALTAKNYRLMVVMEKVREPRAGDLVEMPEVIRDVNFRETYFEKR